MVVPKTEPDALIKKDASPPPPTTYRDIPLFSCGASESKTHLIKLAHHALIDPRDPARFIPPLKLNRKVPPKLKPVQAKPGDAILDRYGNPMMGAGPDGKAALLWPGTEEEIKAVEAILEKSKPEKGPQADLSLIAPTSANASQRNKAKLFQKKVKEIHKASASARRTWNDERFPWILEDFDTSRVWESARSAPPTGIAALQAAIDARKAGLPSAFDVKPDPQDGSDSKSDAGNHAPWIGKLEGDQTDGVNQVLFVFDSRDEGGFRVVPVDKAYKFLQKAKHAKNPDEAEKEFAKHQKARADGANRWMYKASDGKVAGPSVPGRVKKEEGADDMAELAAIPEWKHLSLPKGFKVRDAGKLPVDNVRRGRRDRDEGTYGEVDFEEEMADDDDHNAGEEFDMGDEETHELEERMKQEMARAEHSDADDDDDDLFGAPGGRRNDILTGSGKQMQKIVRALARNQGNEAYEDEANPYLSEDSDTEDTAIANPEAALRKVREDREREERERAKNGGKKAEEEAAAAAAAAAAMAAAAAKSSPKNRDEKHSRPGIPSSSSGKHHKPGAGHASVAQRATSPGNRASKHGNRSASPSGRNSPRATSPMATDASAGSKKRKSEAPSGSSSGGAAVAAGPSGKRARTATASRASPDTSPSGSRAGSPSRSRPLSDLEKHVCETVKSNPGISESKGVVTLFRKELRDDAKKKAVFDAIKKLIIRDPDTGFYRVRDVPGAGS